MKLYIKEFYKETELEILWEDDFLIVAKGDYEDVHNMTHYNIHKDEIYFKSNDIVHIIQINLGGELTAEEYDRLYNVVSSYLKHKIRRVT